MNRKLENKVAVITGGSAGIGLGAAKRFGAEGARVFITGRRQSELDKAVVAIEGNVTAIQGDASKLADIDRIYQTVKQEAGRIDVLFVNADFYEFGRLGEITESISTRHSIQMSAACSPPCRRPCRFCLRHEMSLATNASNPEVSFRRSPE
jgi:NAD(P)-dependent dehydrogenase (short-subunit alcohol dehydrogenase family)